MAGPEVPFPMKPLDDEPGIPFLLKALDEVMCRDCPFPAFTMSPEEAVDFNRKLQAWKDAVLRHTHEKLSGSTLAGLLEGRELLVLKDDQGAPFDKHFNRVIVRVDAHNIVTHVQEGV